MGRTLANSKWKNTGNNSVRVRRECLYPKSAKDVSQVRLAITQWEDKWKAMMSELGGDVKTPDLWRMPAFVEMCPKNVNGQMMMRLDEIGENYENLKANVVPCMTNRTEQARGGPGRYACADGGEPREW